MQLSFYILFLVYNHLIHNVIHKSLFVHTNFSFVFDVILLSKTNVYSLNIFSPNIITIFFRGVICCEFLLLLFQGCSLLYEPHQCTVQFIVLRDFVLFNLSLECHYIYQILQVFFNLGDISYMII